MENGSVFENQKKQLRTVLQSNPDNQEVHHQPEVLYMTLERPADARNAFQKAVELDHPDTLVIKKIIEWLREEIKVATTSV